MCIRDRNSAGARRTPRRSTPRDRYNRRLDGGECTLGEGCPKGGTVRAACAESGGDGSPGT
eukprot:6348813-Alexandrium_andersonii.AAC.1